MYKVVIVEDSLYVRDAIAKMIEEALSPFSVCATYPTADEALSQLQSTIPDIVITDIRMPGTSGLEFAKTLYEQFPHIKVIIVSGFGDFEYAQKAIRFGVCEYLLKPCSEQDLLSALHSVAKKINKETDTADLKKMYLENFNLHIPTLRQHMFISLIQGYSTNFSERMSQMLLHDWVNPICIWVIKTEPTTNGIFKADEVELLAFSCCNIFEELLDNFTSNEVFCMNDVIICIAEISTVGFSEVHAKIENICGTITDIFDCAFHISSGSVVNSILNCGESYRFALSNQLPMPQLTIEDMPPSVKIILDKATAYIQANYQNDLSLEAVADKIFISANYLSSLFSHYLGINFSAYLTRIRMERACKLLQNPKYKIANIAEKIGYSNYRYFNSVFKKALGVTPTEYRRNAGNYEKLNASK